MEEREGAVGRAVAAGRAARRCGAVEGSLFEGEVGVQVDLGGVSAFVAEPERDDGD